MFWQVDFMPYNLSAKLEKKLLDSFGEIKLLSEKLTDDDGRLGISRAPLPFGWRS